MQNSPQAHNNIDLDIRYFFGYPNLVVPSFYNEPAYRQKQSRISKFNWQAGKYQSLTRSFVVRECANPGCLNQFKAKPYDPKKYCSHSCAAGVSNQGRIQTIQTRQKISHWFKTHSYFIPHNPKHIATLTCSNPDCRSLYSVPLYLAKKRKYCSSTCAIKIIGGQTTSPKASKGKPGIRTDIDPQICFYSTWEANIARVFNLTGVKWQYAPKIFDLGLHTYRPDFYLPDNETYIEVKNFMGDYSKMRDSLFRSKFPNTKLHILSKYEYKQIEQEYKPLIENWES